MVSLEVLDEVLESVKKGKLKAIDEQGRVVLGKEYAGKYLVFRVIKEGDKEIVIGALISKDDVVKIIKQ